MEETFEVLKGVAARLRADSIRATAAAGSGHPTTCCSAAEIMACLFFGVMHYDPKDPRNPVADRFVLSKGHAAPILFAAWKENGYYSDAQLMTLRKVDSDLEGHPTPRLPFVDVATGSLGQGLGVGVGLALNSKFLDKTNYRTYVLLGDGEMAEGSVWEAAQLASYYKLDNLVAIVDMNRLGQSQATMLQHDAETMRARFEAFGWGATVVDGHDVKALLSAFDAARRVDHKPHVIVAKTFKGRGVPFAEDKDNWHGKPFKGEDEKNALAALPSISEVALQPMTIPAPPAIAPPAAVVKPMAPPDLKVGDEVATREQYGVALAKLGAVDSRVVALDADTKNSTYSDKFLKAFPDRFFECFIAEQNMVSVAAGLAARGKVPFASSFAVFLCRGFDQIRMAGVSGSNVKFCGSHVGVSIGEDGPSQMGLEDIAVFRPIPNCVVFYPSDGVSAENAVRLAAEHVGMAYIRTSRPKAAVIYPANEPFAIGKAKVVRRSDKDAVTIVAGGVTLTEAMKAADVLAAEGIGVRIIDLFTVKPLDSETILACARQTGNTVLTVEDHYPEGGIGDAVASAMAAADAGIRVVKMAVREVPRSGKPEELVAKYGIDSKAIAARVKEIAGK